MAGLQWEAHPGYRAGTAGISPSHGNAGMLKKYRVLLMRKVMVCVSHSEEINGSHYKGV